MSETELTAKLKKKRGILRASVTRVIQKIEAELSKEAIDVYELELLIEHINEKAEKLKIADADLEQKIATEELEDDLETIEAYTEKITECRFRTRKKIDEIRKSENEREQRQSTQVSHAVETKIAAAITVKLPKLIISKFYGDLKEWLTFWNSYKSAVHDNPSLNEVDKFNYLKSFLGGSALNLVEGLPLTSESYSVATGLLEERFGDKDTLINTHVEQLLKLPTLKTSQDARAFRKLFDHLQKNLRTLETLGITSENYGAILSPLLLRTLPHDLVLEYNKTCTGGFSLEQLLEFLSKQLNASEKTLTAVGNIQAQERNKYSENLRIKRPQKAREYTSSELIDTEIKDKADRCLFCSRSHDSSSCDDRSLTYQQKINKCKEKGLCFKCLSNKPFFHQKKDCRNKIICGSCKSGFHLMPFCFKNDSSRERERERGAGGSVELNGAQSSLWNLSNQQVLLQTLIIKAGSGGKGCCLRAIIDTASSRSFVSEYAARKLRLKCLGTETIKHGLFGGKEEKMKHNKYVIELRDERNRFKLRMKVMDQRKICANIPKIKNPRIIRELEEKGIQLSDLEVKDENCLYENDPSEINMLIGADYVGRLYTGEMKNLSNGLVAMNTRLGWVLMGVEVTRDANPKNALISLHVGDINISDLWALDSIGINDPALTQSKKETEALVIQHFRDTIKRENDGRYEVRLPWLENHPPLTNNLNMAKRRLRSCVKNLKENGYLNQYESVFNNWLDEGIIEKIEGEENLISECRFLPHRAVIKAHATTPVRPVFDASAKEKNSVSLNDCIHPGPNFIELIPKILTKFRIGTYGVTADIRKAFLQIGLNPSDRDYLRFLWQERSEPENLIAYRHKRVVFGVNASMFLLAATIQYHLENVDEKYKNTASKLKDAMYVDNCVTSVNSPSELKIFISEANQIMQEAKFDLRDWQHNFYDRVSEPVFPNAKNADIVNVLGVKWDLKKDTLLLDVKGDFNVKPSKRNVLSVLHKLYDPIGFVSPVTVVPKQILQECWKRKISWDELLPPELEKRFSKWVKQVDYLRKIEIPRRIPVLSHDTTMHVFCDASCIAYATCIFLRHDTGSDINCQLVQSRVKIAPVKPLTIPRLEILSCTIGARLAHTVKENLNLNTVKIFYWSDSLNALYWIKREENWATFIMNRVCEIRELSDASDWRHVPGGQNPADFPSRGCYPKDMENSRWWTGPPWLYLPPETWPSKIEGDVDPEVINAERRKTIVSASNTVAHINEDPFREISDYRKILKIFCWMFRFVKNAKRTPPLRARGPIRVEDIKQAEVILLKFVQKQSFEGVNDKSVRVLRPFVDSGGLIRIKSRIMRREDEEDFRTPILLPADHHIVLKLIKWEHETMGHAGVQFVMNALRERFWILRGRKTIRSVIRKCVKCKKYDAPLGVVPQAVLPENRVREAKVFEILGVDLTGPLYIKGNQKVWIVLFTCAVYRAVHIEIVNNMSTEDLLRALRRFIARRGRPFQIYSDQGSNFLGANNLLNKVDFNKLITAAAEKRIQWHFNPPASPWWGGWWERLIGVLKRILRKVLGKCSLDYERLQTVLCDIESIMNHRPLTHLTDDSTDLVALTPAMFLNDLPVAGVPDLDSIDNVPFRKKLLYIQKLRGDLRNRFRIEYLGQLRQNIKYVKDPTTLKVGDLVLVSSPKKRVHWPLARILQIFPSTDGCVRVIRLKTSEGEITRTVQQVVPLEADYENHSRDFRERLRSSHNQRPQGGSVS